MSALIRPLTLLLFFCLPASLSAAGGELLVFAAASLRDALDAVAERYEAEYHDEVRISYASSSILARQISQGAEADVYISANEQWMDFLAGQGAIDRTSRFNLLGNRLVLVAPGAATEATRERAPEEGVEIDAGLDLRAILGDGYLAMGDPAHVPAGIYGKAALQSLGLWTSLRGRVARAENVRAALALVARGEAPLGVVYRSDAVAEPGVRVVGVFPERSHPQIIYPAAQVNEGSRDIAERLLRYLRSGAAAAQFRAFGFDVLD